MHENGRTHHWRGLLLVICLLAASVACGGGNGGGNGNPGGPQLRVLRVAGAYQIVQQAVETTCNDTGTPATVTGTVTHTAGASTFVMRDTGGTTFEGTVQPDGQFTARAVFGPDSGGQTYTQSLEGRFTTTAFTGRLGVDVQPRDCRFTRNWTATKQGAPNEFP